MKLFFAFVLCLIPLTAQAQYYGRYSYTYPGRGYYYGGHYSERYASPYVPRGYAYRPYHPTPRGSYDWSWGGGSRGYLGGRGGGWGGEW